MSLNRKKSMTEMNASLSSSMHSFYPSNIIDLDIDDEGLLDNDAYEQTYERYQKSCEGLADIKRQAASPKKEDGEMKMITTLIDDCIEEDEFQEAFTLFIRFVKDLDESNKKILFDRYYKMLVEPRN
jgi:hypothetical protein